MNSTIILLIWSVVFFTILFGGGEIAWRKLDRAHKKLLKK